MLYVSVFGDRRLHSATGAPASFAIPTGCDDRIDDITDMFRAVPWARSGAGCSTHDPALTGLRCGRCETLICGKCAVATIVGTRCQGCAPSKPPSLAGGLVQPGSALPLMKIVVAVILTLVTLGVGYLVYVGDYERLTVMSIVLVGWLISVVIHENCHGIVAYLGGDRSVRDRGMLTANPLAFIDPVFSLAIPLFMVLSGGVPLMGGRTLIHSHNLRSKWWDSAVSAAGPASNLVMAIILAAVVRSGVLDAYIAVEGGLAYLAILQVAACLFNLIPIPPFDGFGIIEPHLSEASQMTGRQVGRFGYFIVLFVFFRFEALSEGFWDTVYTIGYAVGVPEWAAYFGWWYTYLW